MSTTRWGLWLSWCGRSISRRRELDGCTNPTPIYRIMHVDNLRICLRREGLHASNHTPEDGLVYRTIHNKDIQLDRKARVVPCGPGGVIHDYVPFYFGPRSPMLFQLHTGRVDGYNEGQEPLVYVVSTAQDVADANLGFVCLTDMALLVLRSGLTT